MSEPNASAAEQDWVTRLADEVIAEATARQGGTLRGLDGQEVPLTEGGLVAAAHRRGAGLLARWLQHRTETPDAPLRPAQDSLIIDTSHLDIEGVLGVMLHHINVHGGAQSLRTA